MSTKRPVPRGVIVELYRVRGSAPREEGARMMVTADGVAGTIGGGALEHAAIARARALLANWRAEPGQIVEMREFHALGPQLGQCCGGAVALAFTPSESGELAAGPPLFHLQLHGAGHVGRAVAAVLATLDCTIDWIDSRLEVFPASLPQGKARISCRRVSDPVTTIAEAPATAACLIMTHAHPLDAALCAAALRRDDLGYVGLIGSATKRARFVSQWRRDGIAPEAIARLSCPIGLPEITGKQPELIALAVAAELVSRLSVGARRYLPSSGFDREAECRACGAAARCAGS